MSVIEPILKGVLSSLLTLLDEDQFLHFRKIYHPIAGLNNEKLIEAIKLIERTLENKDIEYADVVCDAVRKITINEGEVKQ